MTILDTLDEIFDSISLPQNLAKKVALVKSQVATLEKKNIKLEGRVTLLTKTNSEQKIRNEEFQKQHKSKLAGLLQPEQGLVKNRPQVVGSKRRPLTGC